MGIASSQLIYFDETKAIDLTSQTARANENLQLCHGGPSQRQTSDTDPLFKSLSLGSNHDFPCYLKIGFILTTQYSHDGYINRRAIIIEKTIATYKLWWGL